MKRGPAGGVLKGGVGAGDDEGGGGGEGGEAYGEVERRVAAGDVAAVDDGRDFVGDG